MVANANPYIPVIPQWLVNFVTKQIGAKFFEMFKERSINLPEEYKTRIKENKLVYGEVERRLTEFFESQNN